VHVIEDPGLTRRWIVPIIAECGLVDLRSLALVGRLLLKPASVSQNARGILRSKHQKRPPFDLRPREWVLESRFLLTTAYRNCGDRDQGDNPGFHVLTGDWTCSSRRPATRGAAVSLK